MERSCKIFRKIASASCDVVAIANDYADREDYNRVSRYHFRLEEDMRRISVACERLAGILDKRSHKEGLAVDVRIQDWVVGEEPQACLDILGRMKSLLQQKKNTSSWVSRMFRGRGPTTTGMQDKIKEAVALFNSCKGCFHFLFLTETWNNESAVRRQHRTPSTRGQSDRWESDLESWSLIISEVDGAPLSTTLQETVNESDQHRHQVAQQSHEFNSDKQREEEGKKLKEILKWLDGLSCAEKHDVRSSLHRDDTCKWLFDRTPYEMSGRESESVSLRGLRRVSRAE